MRSDEQGAFNGMALWQQRMIVVAEQSVGIHDHGVIPAIPARFAI